MERACKLFGSFKENKVYTYIRIRNFWEHNEEDGLENLTHTGNTESKKNLEKQRVNYLKSRAEERKQILLRVRKDRKLWSANKAHILKAHGIRNKEED